MSYGHHSLSVLRKIREKEKRKRSLSMLTSLSNDAHTKRRSKGKENMDMIENVSVVFQKNLPPKCSDLGMFTIPCMVGNVTVDRAMLDLGASINVMPYSLYTSLDVGPLKPTSVVVQLADKSIVHPRGVLEDVLVKVNELIFPADFYIVDMEENNASKSNMMLLGRPFLKTSRTKIDVYNGTLSMEFGNKLIKFNIHDTMRYSRDVHSLCFVNAYTPLTDNVSALTNDFVLKEKLSENDKLGSSEKITKALELNDDTSKRIAWMEMGPKRPLPDLLCHEYWSAGDAMKIEEVPPGRRGTGLENEIPWPCWDVG
ncbi:hypothetical protein OSB04_029026 [Centaurea solstitialis]|uniref:Uncharacterized protein n=1 Tax=Centaurea solstitialis TaxID=347529 RepID=A0AA38SGY2_9ASTR|nr:hypothetical protein OSB04_029026 [Centaurea solstitialis]